MERGRRGDDEEEERERGRRGDEEEGREDVKEQ